MADTDLHWSSAAARARYAAEQAEANRPKTIAEKIYGKTPANGEAQRLRSIRAGVAKPSGRQR